MTPQEVAELSQLLDRALELDPASRETWLDELEFARPALSARLREMLQAAATGETRLPPLPRLTAEDDAVAASGDRVGPYRLIREIGRGGMGSVWLAERADGAFQRQVALKLPRLTWSAGLAKRMAREREIGALLEHPHIARLYDAGVDERGRPFIAMEYVDGQAIDAYCRDRGLDLRARLKLFLQVVKAVAYAHGRLVLHRDLKPGNVLVDAGGEAHLLDFGIAKVLDEASAEGTQLTQEQGRALTLNYAAPEQIMGRPLGVTADVYSLGVMLYELLTGALPYSLKRNTRGALEEAILAGDAPPASSRVTDPRTARALRGDLDAIVQTAMRRDPDKRYPSAIDLAQDLESYLTSRPVQAQVDSALYRLRKFIGRNRLPVAAGAAVMLALASGLGVALWQAEQARHQAEQARLQAERATALNTFVLSLIRQFDPHTSQTSKAADLPLLSSIEQRIDAEFKGSADQLLQLRVAVGDAYRNRGEMMAARRVFLRAVEEASPHLPPDDLQLLRARVQAADFNLAISMAVARDLDVAIDLLRTKGADGAATLIDALLIKRTLGGRFHVPEQLSLQEMDALYDEAYQLATRNFGAGSRERLKVVEELAFHLSFLKNPHTRPVDLLRSELEAAQTRPDVVDTLEFLTAKASYGRFLYRDGQHAEGMRQMQSAVETIRSSYGASSLQLELPLSWTYEVLRNLNDPTAIGFLQESLRVAAARERPPSTNLLRRSEYVLYVALGDHRLEMAEDAYQQAIANLPAVPEEALQSKFALRLVPGRVALLALSGRTLEAETLGTSSDASLATFYWSWQLIGLSLAQRQNGRYAAAVETTRRYEQMCAAMKGSTAFPPCMFVALSLRTMAQLDAGDPAAALRSANQALEFRKEFWSDPGGANLGLAVGRARLANGLAKEAIEPLRQAYGYWLSCDPRSHWAAETEYWFGRAWIASGNVKRGRWMVAEAKSALATSPFRTHRALSAAPEP